jgi:hypothetical protein
MTNTNESNYILPSIFYKPFHVRNYSDIMKDTSINGKFKFLLNYKADNRGCPGSILLHYLLQYVDSTSTIFSYNTRAKQHAWRRRESETNRIKSTDTPLRLPSIPYRNLKCNYNNHTLWVSNIFISSQLEDNQSYPPSLLVLSIESDVGSFSEFIDTGFMNNLYKSSKIWHMTNILGEVYDENNFFEVYTFSEGYWELKKGNYIRDQKTLFLKESKYNRLISKIDQFGLDKTRQIYRRLNLPYKLNVLLHGPPGTGKTSFIEVMASNLKRNIRFMQITPKITDEQFSTAVSQLGDNDILVCEDIDCLFTDRKDSDSKKNAMTFSGLLNSLDGINGGKNGLIVFMTTNYKCRLDSALTRPGRIDITEEFEYMDKVAIQQMIKFYFEDNYNEKSSNKLYEKCGHYNITGAIMSNFLLGLLLNEDYNLEEHSRELIKMLEENNYEKEASITKSLYT